MSVHYKFLVGATSLCLRAFVRTILPTAQSMGSRFRGNDKLRGSRRGAEAAEVHSPLRHAELVSASIVPHRPKGRDAKWTLEPLACLHKQVQDDGHIRLRTPIPQHCHSRESENPWPEEQPLYAFVPLCEPFYRQLSPWVPAFAGMTNQGVHAEAQRPQRNVVPTHTSLRRCDEFEGERGHFRIVPVGIALPRSRSAVGMIGLPARWISVGRMALMSQAMVSWSSIISPVAPWAATMSAAKTR